MKKKRNHSSFKILLQLNYHRYEQLYSRQHFEQLHIHHRAK